MLARLRVVLGVVFGVLLAGALLSGALSRLATAETKAAARTVKVVSSAKSGHAAHDLRKVKTGWSAFKSNLRHDERSTRTMLCDDDDDDDDDDSPDLSTVPRSNDGDDVRADDAFAESVEACEPREIPTTVSLSHTPLRASRGHAGAKERPPRA